MAEDTLTHDATEVEDDEFEHETRIVDRVMDSIYPEELPDDVDAGAVAYFLWSRLTTILFWCGYTSEDLVAEVREAGLEESAPEGNA